MQKVTPERFELDVNDRIAVENAICDKINALNRIIENKDAGFRDIEEGIAERKRLRDIYRAIIDCKVFIEHHDDGV